MFASGLRGVIFDCDGVMIDSVAANRIFFDRCLAYYGLPPMTDEQAAYCNMSTSRQGLEHILPERAKKDIPRFGRDIVNECLSEGIIINCTVGKVLRFIPPLIISEEQVDEVISALAKVLEKYV